MIVYASNDSQSIADDTALPLVSVVMPAYNAAEFIGDAIESVLNQTLQQFELIIVDDGSKDGTGDIARAYAAKDERIRIIPGEHKGAAHAMNLGIRQARADWVAVMHSDDIALPSRLERQYSAAQACPEVVIWGTDGYHINSKGEMLSRFRVGPLSVEEWQAEREKNRVVQCIHPTVLLRRDVLLAVGGYDPTLRVCEDIELFDRMMVHGPLVTIPELLLGYRIHGASLSMKHYFEQLTIVHFVTARQEHRQKTGEELSLDEFRRRARRRSRLWWLNEQRMQAAGMYYRRAGLAYGENRPLALVGFLLLSMLLAPLYPIRRLWVQVIGNGIDSMRRRRVVEMDRDTAKAKEEVLMNGNGQNSGHDDTDDNR
jgi:glycosyltransferase involved in cell wall biosynthesis